MAQAAARGYEYLAITDHAQDLAMSGASRDELARQRAQIDALRSGYPRMALLHGAELNIGKDGGVDYDAGFRRTLEWCVAGVHSHFELDRPAQTRRVLAAMEDPTVDAIAHLTGAASATAPASSSTSRRCCARRSRPTPRSRSTPRSGGSTPRARCCCMARGMDVTFVVSTDTHHEREFARMEWGVLQATRGWVEPSRIANLWPRERFLKWVRQRRSRAQP